MMVQRHSAQWTTLFGHLDEVWVSRMPSHQVLTDGLVDPSVWPQKLLGTGPSSDDNDQSQFLAQQTNSAGIRELHSLAQNGMRHLVTQFESSNGTGILSSLEDALAQVMEPQAIGLSVATDLVVPLLTDPSKAGKKVASALFAAGMSALSCTGPIGAAAAAIIGFATFIAKLFIGRKKWKEKERKDQMRRAFQSMPPLQVAGSESDEYQVRQVYAALETGSWTHLFSPRFDPRREWVGAPRNGGYGFAPGHRFDTKDEFGIDTARFEASGGIGFNPATGSCTSVVQVSLDPIGDAVQKWFDSGGIFPVERAHVRDVGDFYQSTSRLCGIAWAMATQEHASPHLYKVDVGTPDSARDNCLHLLWKRYFEGAINYIKVNGQEWTYWENFGLSLHGRAMDRERPEFLLGSALSCVAGSWACKADTGWTPDNPKMKKHEPPLTPKDMVAVGTGLTSGCVIEPRQALLTPPYGSLCLVSVYDGRLKELLEQVRARQEDFLRTTVVSAYVHSGWDAFRDPDLSEQLKFVRSKLLINEPALAAVRLRDVPRDDKFNGKSWYEQLKAAGAGRLNKLGLRPAGTGAVEPPQGPPAKIAEFFAPPFQEDPNPVPDPAVLQKIGMGAGAAASSYLLYRLVQRYGGLS